MAATESKPTALSHADRCASHKASKEASTREHRAASEQLKSRVVEVDRKHADEIAKLDREAHEAHEAAFAAAQHAVLASLREPLAAFIADSNRANAARVASAFRDAEAEAVRTTAYQLNDGTLFWAFAERAVEQDASLLFTLGNFRASIADSAAQAAYDAVQACRDPSPAAASRVLAALLKLEQAVAAQATNISNRLPEASAARHWETVRFGGSPASRQATLAALEKAEWQARVSPAKLSHDFGAYQKRQSRGFQVLDALSDLKDLAVATAHSVLDQGSK